MSGARGRIRAVGCHERVDVSDWQVHASAPGALQGPSELSSRGDSVWTPALVPGTAASALRAAGTWSLDGAARRFDAADWWWRGRVATGAAALGEETVLCVGGLATIADVWFGGAHVLASDDMFLAHDVPITPTGDDEIVIRCRALDGVLAARRPRPRWRAPMVEHQQLRWVRATLLGRTPGWSPPAAAVGPWRGVWIERRRRIDVRDVRLDARVDGAAGRLVVACDIRAIGAAVVRDVEIVVERADHEGPVARAALVAGEREAWAGVVIVPDVARWWPHTHGDPALYRARLRARVDGGIAGAEDVAVDLGTVGFRELAVDTSDGDFSVSINGANVFCRGACWTPLDPVSLGADRATTEAAIDQACRAGMNMLRVGGTMVYESDDFLDLCDERGVLVWQDFMFANMDYPDDDAAFVATASAEARQELARWAGRPSLAIVCGNSEGEQQAAMWGAARERWSPPLFHEVLSAITRELAPRAAYWPSSAHGGAFPHQPDRGTTSYYGVGAYLRPLDDARRSEVRFASECLAFANVPAARALPGGESSKVHHPAWKARTPRDLGAGWDFDDVRDHYVERLFRVDPLALRYADHDRYLALGRAATGEVMAATFAEWRRARSVCRGGLVWFLRDLWTGAGWGVVDASGAPKSPWHYLRRALAPVAVSISDEGNGGLVVHVVNDRAAALDAVLELTLWRAGEIKVASATRALEVPGRGALELSAIALLDGFMDLSNAYRFGPPLCDLVVATLRAGDVVADAFAFPIGLPSTRELDVGLDGETMRRDDGDVDVTVRTRRFAQSVTIEADGFVPDDDWFHLAPGAARTVRLRRFGILRATAPTRATVTALNAETTARLTIAPVTSTPTATP